MSRYRSPGSDLLLEVWKGEEKIDRTVRTEDLMIAQANAGMALAYLSLTRRSPLAHVKIPVVRLVFRLAAASFGKCLCIQRNKGHGRISTGATVGFFKQAGVSDSNIAYVNKVAAGHAFITPSFGNVCSANASPYISHCQAKGQGYDQAGALLQHIYGPLKSPAQALTGKVLTFDQRQYAPVSTGMADNAFVYVPKSCSNGASCKVHVALHGCMQSASVVGDEFYSDTGYNQWADMNQIIVLYPQVNASSDPFNPNGCWDWFGYTGPDYATKSGPQMVAIKATVDRLTSGK